MVNKYFDGKVPKYNGTPNEVDEQLENYALEQVEKFEQKIDNYEIANSIQEIWNLISRTNKYIDETAPWVLFKEGKLEELKSVMYHLVENLRRIAILIAPYMKHTSQKILSELSIPEELQTWNSLESYNKIENLKVTDKPEVLFARLEQEQEIEVIKGMMK